MTIGENGLFATAKYAVKKSSEQTAKEKLELILANMQTNKYIEETYNENEYIDNYLRDENINVSGNIVTIDNWNFEIDRMIPSIKENSGKSEISITKEVEEYLGKNEDDKYMVLVLVNIESNIKIESIEFENIDGTKLTIIPESQKVSKDMQIELDKEYKVAIKMANGKVENKTIIERSTENIRTVEELVDFRDKVNSGLTYEGKTLKLISDIDLGSICNAKIGNWMPIGNAKKYFKGIFDGKNHKIENVYINIRNTNNVGLFGYNEGIIKNLDVSGDITSSESRNGILVGYNVGELKDITTYGIVKGWNYTGGITGYNTGNIYRCTNNAEVTYSIGAGGKYGKYEGGISGYSQNGKIEKCINNGKIKANYRIGGILGFQGEACEVSLCINNGYILGHRDSNSSSENIIYAGGICGRLTGKIKNCFNTGTIKSDSGGYLAGIASSIGNNSEEDFMIENCYNVGKVSGGGIAYNIATGKDTDLYNNYWHIDCGSSYGLKSIKSNNNAQAKNEQEFNKLSKELGEEYINDIQEIRKNEDTGEEEIVWKYNNGYPILKWQVEDK